MIAIFDGHAATRFAHLPELAILEPPIPLQAPTALMIWHPRHNGDAGHAWLRQMVLDLHQQGAATLTE